MCTFVLCSSHPVGITGLTVFLSKIYEVSTTFDSAADRAAIQKEVDEATEQLATTTDDYTSFIRSVGSEAPYVDLFYNKTAFPSDVVARLDSASVGSVYGLRR